MSRNFGLESSGGKAILAPRCSLLAKRKRINRLEACEISESNAKGLTWVLSRTSHVDQGPLPNQAKETTASQIRIFFAPPPPSLPLSIGQCLHLKTPPLRVKTVFRASVRQALHCQPRPGHKRMAGLETAQWELLVYAIHLCRCCRP